MARVGELIGKALPAWAQRAERPAADPSSRLPVIHDYCSCRKPQEHGSSGGYHLRRFDEGDLRREVARALSQLPADSSEAHRASVERNTRELFAPHVGMPIAYEPCPAYRAAVSRNAKQRPGGGDQRRLRLIDEEDEG